MSGELIRLLVVDDHLMVREGLTRLFAEYPDIELLGAVADGSQAVSECEREAPDVILMDLEMPVMDGVEGMRRILARRPQIRIVVLTSFADRDRIRSAAEAGACGYLLKDAPPDELVRGIRSAARGEEALAPRVAAWFGEASAPTRTGL